MAEAKRVAAGHGTKDAAMHTIAVAYSLSRRARQPFPLDLRSLSWPQARALNIILGALDHG